MIITAFIALALLALLTLFQIALVCGAPFGHFAWGGKHRILPPKLRIGSSAAILLYAFFAALVAAQSDLWIIITNPTLVSIGLWVVAAYMTLGVFMNAISRSKPERFVMTPVALVLTICFVVLAMS